MENKFKPIKLETTENKPIVFDTQEMFNQEYINNLIRLISNPHHPISLKNLQIVSHQHLMVCMFI